MRTVRGLGSKEGGISRTGSRTPMQWAPGPQAGFSTADLDKFYLPVDPESDRPDVASQTADPGSLLNRVRSLISLRRAHPALCASGEFEPVYAEAGKLPFVYWRQLGDEKILIAINPADQPCEVTLDLSRSIKKLLPLYGQPDAFKKEGEKWRVTLAGVSAGVYSVQA